MPTKLKQLRIDEGSFVDKGANQHAKVVFFKRDVEIDKGGPGSGPQGGGESNNPGTDKTFARDTVKYALSNFHSMGNDDKRIAIDDLKQALKGYPEKDSIISGIKMMADKNEVPDAESRNILARQIRGKLEDGLSKVDNTSMKGGDEMDVPTIDDISLDYEAITAGVEKHLDEIEKAGRKISKETAASMEQCMSNMQSAIDKMKGMMPSSMSEHEEDEEEMKMKKERDRKGIWKGSDNMPITDEVRKSLDEPVQEYLAELEKQSEESKTKVDELTAKVDELSKKADPEPEDIWKGVNPKVKEEFEATKKRADEAEDIAKAEREMRISKQYTDEAGSFPHMGSIEDVSKMLRSADEQDAEIGKKLRETLSAAQAKIDANDRLTKELGGGGEGSGDGAWGKLEAMAKEIQKSDSNLSEAQAMDKVLKTKEGKDLYDEYQAEGSVN